MKILELIVPDQMEGWQSDAEEVVKSKNTTVAKELYNIAAKKF